MQFGSVVEIQVDFVRVRVILHGFLHGLESFISLGRGAIIIQADDDVAAANFGLLGDHGRQRALWPHFLFDLRIRHRMLLGLKDGIGSLEKACVQRFGRDFDMYVDALVRGRDRA